MSKKPARKLSLAPCQGTRIPSTPGVGIWSGPIEELARKPRYTTEVIAKIKRRKEAIVKALAMGMRLT